MFRAVLLDQIVRQLVREHYPPIRGRLDPCVSNRALHLPLMQLLEEPEIAEYTPAGIECDCAPALVVE